MNKELLELIKASDTVGLENLISKGLDIKNEKDGDGHTPLMYAASMNQIAVVEYLLNKGYAQINEKDRYGKTALHVAIEKNNIKLVKLLLNTYHANIYYSYKGKSPLMLASELPDNSDPDQAMISTKEELIKTLLEAGAYIHEQEANSKFENDKANAWFYLIVDAKTHIQVASYASSSRTFDTLGTAMNGRDFNTGNTALHVAIEKNNFKMLSLLLAAGADINMPNKNDDTPIMLLSRSSNPYYKALSIYLKLKQTEKKLLFFKDTQANCLVKKSAQENKEIKEVTDLKEVKEIKERRDMDSTYKKEMASLELQYKKWMEDTYTNETLNPMKVHEALDLSLKIAKLLLNIELKLFDPAWAIKALEQILIHTDHSKFYSIECGKIIYDEARELALTILVSKRVIVTQGTIPNAFIFKNSTSDLEENKELFELRIKAIIQFFCERYVQKSLVEYIFDFIYKNKNTLPEIEKLQGKDAEFTIHVIKKVKERVETLEEILRKNDVKSLAKLIENGSDIRNYRFGTLQDMSAFQYAVHHNHLQLIDYFLEKGLAKVDEVYFDSTALNIATYNGKLSTMQYLLDKWKAKLDERSVIYHVSGHDYVDILTYFLEEKGIAIMTTDFYHGCRENVKRIGKAVQELLKLSKENQIPGTLDKLFGILGKSLNGRDQSTGNTALHWAIYNRNSSLARALLENGANTNISNRENVTPEMLLSKDENPFFRALHGYAGLRKIEKELNKLTTKDLKITKELKELKEVHEVKELKEKHDVTFASDYALCLSKIKSNLDRMELTDDVIELYLAVCKLLLNIDSSLSNPAEAYTILSTLLDKPKLPEKYLNDIHTFLLEILVSKRIVFTYDEQSEAYQYENASFETCDIEESKQVLEYRLECIIKHILQCKSVHDETLASYITHYVNGHQGSLLKIEGLTGKSLDLNMGLIRNLKKVVEQKRKSEEEHQLEIKKLREENAKQKRRILELEKQSQTPILAQFSSLQNKTDQTSSYAVFETDLECEQLKARIYC